MIRLTLNYRFLMSIAAIQILVASCRGQGKTDFSQDGPGKHVTFTSRHPRLVKSQGTDAYQNIHCGLQDKKGILWFGTTGEGVYCYDGNEFTQLTVKDGLSSNKIWSILEDKSGIIWFGTDAGICRYDGKTITAVSIPVNSSYAYSSIALTSAANAVTSIIEGKDGRLWFGTKEGVFCYDGKTFAPFLNSKVQNKSNLTLKDVQCMLEDRDGNMWFGSGPMAFEGIARYDGSSLENFRPENENWIRNIIQDKDGSILFATRHYGVCSYDGKNFKFITDSKGWAKQSMMAILEDRKGNLWFASDYGKELNDTVGGAWRYDGHVFTKFSTKEGLTNNAVFLILEDREGNIWFGTRSMGLYRYDGKSIVSYSE